MKHIAVVAILRRGKLLMGRRKDDKKWTQPGGHLNPNEHPLEGAVREVKEETGIQLTPNLLHHVATVVNEERGLTLYMFKVDLDMAGKHPSTIKMDPDEECHRWHWVSIKSGMNPDIWNNLHVPYSDNIVLQHLGVCMGVEKSEFYIKSEKLVGGLADGNPDGEFPEDKLKAGTKTEREHTSDKQQAKEIAKDHLTEDKEYYVKLKKIEKSTAIKNAFSPGWVIKLDKSESFYIDLKKS